MKEKADGVGASLETLEAVNKATPAAHADLLTRLSEALRDSDFVVVDLSPPEEGESTGFNANVMFELGRAWELKRPTFLICDAKVFKNRGLPFDIAPIETVLYDFGPDGLWSSKSKRASRLESWSEVEAAYGAGRRPKS